MVDHDVMMGPAQQNAVLDAGFPAAGFVLDMVDLARRRRLPAAAGEPAELHSDLSWDKIRV